MERTPDVHLPKYFSQRTDVGIDHRAICSTLTAATVACKRQHSTFVYLACSMMSTCKTPDTTSQLKKVLLCKITFCRSNQTLWHASIDPSIHFHDYGKQQIDAHPQAVVLMSMVMFLFGVAFMQGLSLHAESGTATEQDVFVMQTFFPSLIMTILTLFMSITGGVNWSDIFDVLLHSGLFFGMLFVLYIALTVLAVLNIVTGLFVNEALEHAMLDRDVRARIELERRQSDMETLKEIFAKVDVENTGRITLDQFVAYMEIPQVKALFAVMGLDISDAVAFFEALDVDGSQDPWGRDDLHGHGLSDTWLSVRQGRKAFFGGLAKCFWSKMASDVVPSQIRRVFHRMVVYFRLAGDSQKAQTTLDPVRAGSRSSPQNPKKTHQVVCTLKMSIS